jgi:hypothetical protein
MKRTQLVTCPESAHLEEIEYEEDADGRIVKVCRCTAIDQGERRTCGTTCARRLNQRLAQQKALS